jgi:hypothetical protein
VAGIVQPTLEQARRSCWVIRAAGSLKSGLALTPGSDPESASSFPWGGFVSAVWSSCLWPVVVRGEELAVALSTTPNSTSANAWPARSFQALPRQIPGSI